MKKVLIESIVLACVYFPMLVGVRWVMNTQFPALHLTYSQVVALYFSFHMFQLTYKAYSWSYKETV
jgi:hypothetical protein